MPMPTYQTALIVALVAFVLASDPRSRQSSMLTVDQLDMLIKVLYAITAVAIVVAAYDYYKTR